MKEVDYDLLNAISQNNNTKAEEAIRNGADVNFKFPGTFPGNELNRCPNWTPLHFAAEKANIPLIINLLIKKGANIEARSEAGGTPLHCAAVNDREDSALSLIKNGANIEAKDNEGCTPLHCAIKDNFFPFAKIFDLLIKNRANINTRDNDGNTPLHSAAKFKAKSSFLLKNGAILDIKNNEGKTPLDVARSVEENSKTIKLLEDFEKLNSAWNSDEAISKTEIENKIKSCDTKSLKPFIANKVLNVKRNNPNDQEIDADKGNHFYDNRKNIINIMEKSSYGIKNSKNLEKIKSLEEILSLNDCPSTLEPQSIKVIKETLGKNSVETFHLPDPLKHKLDHKILSNVNSTDPHQNSESQPHIMGGVQEMDAA